MKRFAIIVAGGSGSRMQTAVPKQFLLLNGMPVLMHTIRAFSAVQGEVTILLTLPEAEMNRWAILCNEFNFQIPHQIVKGGATRYHSVKNALDEIADQEGVVAIHDGVRPLIEPHMIDASFNQALAKGSAVVAVSLKDSIRKINSDGTNTYQQRADFMLVQTPQTFLLKPIKKAYEKGYQHDFTDDASVFEANGEEVFLLEGDYSNLKITTPEDMQIAEILLKKKSE